MCIKVSVIIPVYNVEKYLRECLDSVVNQTLHEIEIICINDGSTDNSLNILEEYAQKDSRIRIINQSNQGQSVSRNRGTDVARGEYIGFVDSDDYIDLDFYEKLYNSVKKFNSDIGLANICRIKNKKQKYWLKLKNECHVYKTKDKYKLCKIPKYNYITNKIYKRERLIAANIKFEEGVIYEDIEWTHKVIYYLNDLSTADTNYYYRYNPLSTVAIRNEERQKALCDAFKKAVNFVQENRIRIKNWNKYPCYDKKVYKFCGVDVLVIKKYGSYKYYYLFGIIRIFAIIINHK